MAHNKPSPCSTCLEGQKREDRYRIQSIGRRVFYSLLQNDNGEGYEEDEEEIYIFVCNNCYIPEKITDYKEHEPKQDRIECPSDLDLGGAVVRPIGPLQEKLEE
jgi:hypothetical protein